MALLGLRLTSSTGREMKQVGGREHKLLITEQTKCSGSTGALRTKLWGAPTDIPVPADYDGDGLTDIAVWRPSEGNWYVIPSRTGQAFVKPWGTVSDVPVP
jgi:hypothetical protein